MKCPVSAIVLATAVQGTRFAVGRREEERPHALLRVGGLSLVQHSLYRLHAAGLRRFTVVLGCQAARVEKLVRRTVLQPGADVSCILAPDWRAGEGACLATAVRRTATSPCLTVSATWLISPEAIMAMCRQAAITGETTVLAREPMGQTADSGREIGAVYVSDSLLAWLREAQPSVSSASSTLPLERYARKHPVHTVNVREDFARCIDSPAAKRQAENLIVNGLNKGKKDGFLSQHIGRKISCYVSMALAPTAVTPNQLTWIGFGLMLAAGAMLARGGRWLLGGAVSALLASLFDGCDGEVARLRYRQTRAGAWLDIVLDRYGDAALALGATWSAYTALPEKWVVFLGGVSLLGFIMSSHAKKEYHICYGEPYPPTVVARLGLRDIHIAAAVLGALAGYPFIGVVTTGLLSHVVVAWMLWSARGTAQARA